MADDPGNTTAGHVLKKFHLHFKISYICPQNGKISVKILFLIYRHLHLLLYNRYGFRGLN